MLALEIMQQSMAAVEHATFDDWSSWTAEDSVQENLTGYIMMQEHFNWRTKLIALAFVHRIATKKNMMTFSVGLLEVADTCLTLAHKMECSYKQKSELENKTTKNHGKTALVNELEMCEDLEWDLRPGIPCRLYDLGCSIIQCVQSTTACNICSWTATFLDVIMLTLFNTNICKNKPLSLVACACVCCAYAISRADDTTSILHYVSYITNYKEWNYPQLFAMCSRINDTIGFKYK